MSHDALSPEDVRSLQESEARFRAIADSPSFLLWTAGPDGGCEWVNRGWCEFTGRTPEQELGVGWLEGVHPEDRQRCVDEYGACVQRRETFRFEYRLRRHDGEYRWVIGVGRPYVDAGGRFAGYVGSELDITDRKRAEQAIQESEERARHSEERLRLALAASGQAVWEYDVANDRTVLGVEWETITGHSRESCATLEGWLRFLHPDDRERCRVAMGRCIEGETDRYEGEYRVARPGKGWCWLGSRGRVTDRDAQGRALRMLGTMMDVDALHGLQERLLASTRLASLGTLAAGVAHEINNPLTWLLASLSEVLERAGAPDGRGEHERLESAELRELVGDALQGARRIASVVQAMRSLGRPERPPELEDVDVRAELLSAIQVARNEILQRARLDVEVPEALPRVRSGAGELGRVFLNLLVNAAQAILAGNATANRVAVAARAEGDEVVVEVADSGVGLVPDVKERIFEPFFTTKDGQGTGLGLTLSRNIVESAGGRIEVESDGAGATFRIRLPASPRAPAGATEASREPPSRRRVLVVDDEPLVRRALERMLRPHHDVTVAGSASEALRLVEADGAWDAILCDLMMPDQDGVAFHEALAASRPALLPRLGFITGGAFGERAASFLAERRVRVVPKPLQPATLLDVVEELAGS